MSDEPAEPFGAETLREMRAARLEIAKSSYSQIFDKLWITNGAGAAAVFTRAGDMLKDSHSNSHLYLWPLGFFILGALLPVVGNAIALFIETANIYDMESANSLLDLKIDGAKRPTAQAGLTLRDPRTWCAFFSTAALVIGGIWGFYLLTEI